ncbi:MAG: patatin-like phospholipase family protein [Xanthomonadales bacterium]|jgi:predicted acylesterase/phospholipase RssA|nr:patatin-like phospholipase family protein [Xanthomonadales bacterium]MDH3924281.1 patatin-like phospholipase family protein [Xanthomonadales bacterium]MDH4000394.1 patatin-like phospholipase family protein [Xanthomonadales bacterium]
MLTLHPAKKQTTVNTPRIGLAIAGGGPVGAIYELGALRAVDEAIRGLRLHDLDIYVGVSAGAFIAASLANDITTADMCRIFTGHNHAEYLFEPEKLLKPAYREYLQRARQVPGVVTDSLIDIVKHPLNASVARLMGSLGQAIPSGIFDNEAINRFLMGVFESSGRSNDFADLKKKLYIVAVDLDTGAAVRFGGDDHRDISISRAVQASAALPGMYPPVKIGDQYYVDGALRRTMHASVALDEGVDLLLGINPLVPYDSSSQLDDNPHIPIKKLIQGGLPLILSQTFRALIQSRMNVAFRKYRETHPETDLMLVEPNRGDEEIFFTNIFSFASRNALCDHAYRLTRMDLLRRADELDETLARHGLSLDRELLQQHSRSLQDSLNAEWSGHSKVGRNLSRILDDLEWELDRLAVG